MLRHKARIYRVALGRLQEGTLKLTLVWDSGMAPFFGNIEVFMFGRLNCLFDHSTSAAIWDCPSLDGYYKLSCRF